MSAQSPPSISSFVIRFVVEEPAAGSAVELDEQLSFHGSIRHVQSDESIHFSVWRDAVEFIRRYVPLEREVPS